MKSNPYWWDIAVPPIAPLERDLPREIDVLVIGAGLTGLSAALSLSKKGKSVLVLDAMAPGEGASSRNGGMIGGGHRLSVAQLTAQFGKSVAHDLLFEAHCASGDYALKLMQDWNIDCDYTQSGRFRGLWTSKEYERAARGIDHLKSIVPVEAYMVPENEQRSEVGSDIYAGGTVYPLHGGLNPAKWVRGLLEATQRSGILVQGHTPVIQLSKENNIHLAQTPRGAIKAGNVLVATNGYTDAAVSFAHRRIVPIPSFLTASHPMPAKKMKALFPSGRMIAESRERHCYYRPSPDGTRLVFGGRAAMFQASDKFAMGELKKLIRQVFPDVGDVGFSHLWRGKTGFTFSYLPHVGQYDDVWYAMGYSGSGNAMAPWLGHKAGLLIADDSDGQTAFQKTPFPTRFWHRGNPWFLPFADLVFRGRDVWHNLWREK